MSLSFIFSKNLRKALAVGASLGVRLISGVGLGIW